MLRYNSIYYWIINNYFSEVIVEPIIVFTHLLAIYAFQVTETMKHQITAPKIHFISTITLQLAFFMPPIVLFNTSTEW